MSTTNVGRVHIWHDGVSAFIKEFHYTNLTNEIGEWDMKQSPYGRSTVGQTLPHCKVTNMAYDTYHVYMFMVHLLRGPPQSIDLFFENRIHVYPYKECVFVREVSVFKSST